MYFQTKNTLKTTVITISNVFLINGYVSMNKRTRIFCYLLSKNHLNPIT